MTLPKWVPIRDELRDEVPYGAPQLDVAVRLNVNENPYGPSPDLAASIARRVGEAAATLNRYPDREALELRTALADYLGHGLGPSNLWAANGSNEVMQQILQAFGGPGRTAVSFSPTYSMYPEYARNTHTRWVTGQRAEDFSIDADQAAELITAEQPHIVIVTSPNNPTGAALDHHTLSAILHVAPGVVVVDEAYAEFRNADQPSALELLSEHRALLVSRTMSKAFAYAGGRLGYVAGDPALIDALRIVRLPYHLSAISQAAALAALEHRDDLLAHVDRLRAERDRLSAWLTEAGFDVAASDSNFILFGTFADRRAIWQGLVDRGVLIRETGPSGWLRVSIGTADEVSAFKAALKEVAPDGPTSTN